MLPAAAGPVLSFVLEKKRALLRLARKNCPDAVSKASGQIFSCFSALLFQQKLLAKTHACTAQMLPHCSGGASGLARLLCKRFL